MLLNIVYTVVCSIPDKLYNILLICFFFNGNLYRLDVHIKMCVVLHNKVRVFIFYQCRLACYFCKEKMTFYIYILLYTSCCRLIFCHPIWISEIKIKHKNKEQISERVQSIVQCTTDWKIVFDDHKEKRVRLARREGCGCFSVCSKRDVFFADKIMKKVRVWYV